MKDALLKIERAESHLSEFINQADIYLNKKPMNFVSRFDKSTGTVSISARVTIDPPPNLDLAIGDCIHNLRAALDLAYFSIVGHLTENKRHIQFPIYLNNDSNKSSILKRRMFQLADSRVQAAIESLQPYPGGKYSIYELDQADILDKHRLINPVGRVVSIPTDKMEFLDPQLKGKFIGPGAINFRN